MTAARKLFDEPRRFSSALPQADGGSGSGSGPRLLAGLLAGGILFSSALSSGGASLLTTNLPPVSPALPEVGFSVIRVFGSLALVLALFLGGVWVFRNWQRLAWQRGRSAQLQVLEVKALGGKQALYVIGYQQERLLLAASPAGITLVSHLPPGQVAEPEPQNVSGQNFVALLQQAVQKKT